MESIKFLGKFLFANLFLYGICAFIAFDPNPLNWLLFTDCVGRIIFLFIEMYIIRTAVEN